MLDRADESALRPRRRRFSSRRAAQSNGRRGARRPRAGWPASRVGTSNSAPKYGLATLPAHPYAPPVIAPHPWPPLGCGRHPTRTERGNDHMGSMAINELGPMLTATEVADMLHLHVNTVKRLGDRGELPFYRVCKRGDRRFRLDDMMKFLAQNR